MEGVVKWFNTRKGYGFIKGDDGEDYFIHHTSLEKGNFIRENDRVSFEPVQMDKGKQAKNVRLLQKGSEINNQEKPKRRKEEEENEMEDSTEF